MYTQSSFFPGTLGRQGARKQGLPIKKISDQKEVTIFLYLLLVANKQKIK